MTGRKTILILFFTCQQMVLQAQRFEAGALAGISTSQVDGDHLTGFNKAGIKAGGFVSRKIAAKGELRMEMEFIQKGSSKRLNKDGEYYLMRLNYIEVPVLFNYYLGKKWTIEAGLAFATLISAHEEDETGEVKNAPPFHQNDYQVCIGGNYFITDHLIFNGRYTYSITSIREKTENYDYYYFIGGQYNKVLAFALAYRF